MHPDIPFTSHNSCAVIHLNTDDKESIDDIFEIAKKEIYDDFIEGSDPGLSVAHESQILPSLVAYARDAKDTVLTQEYARTLAKNLNIRLEGLGGTEDGVIGAMAGLGLAFAGNDGRFLLKDNIRNLLGPQPVEKLVGAGIDAVYTLDGRLITEGIILNDENKSVKPCLVNGKCVLFVDDNEGVLKAVKRN
ncbi:MAG: ABC transporter substrate-binding protein [Methanobacterium sp.]